MQIIKLPGAIILLSVSACTAIHDRDGSPMASKQLTEPRSAIVTLQREQSGPIALQLDGQDDEKEVPLREIYRGSGSLVNINKARQSWKMVCAIFMPLFG